MNKKFTFRREPKPAGLSSIGSPDPDTKIKLDKKVIGEISAPTWLSKTGMWSIRFMIIKEDVMEDGNSNCPWMWKTLKKKFENESSARQFILDHAKELILRFDFYYMED